MKNRFPNINPLTGAVVVMALVALVACTKDEQPAPEPQPEPPPVNVVTDIQPVRAATPAQIGVLDRLRGLSAAEQDVLLKQEWPNLSTTVVGWLRRDGRIKRGEKVEKVELFYGSGEADGEDRDGTIHSGNFKDELLANIVITGREKPMLIAIRCMNGMYDVVSGDIHPVGSEQTLVFVIQQGESLVNHVPFETAIHLATTFNLPIHRDRGTKMRQISAEEALQTDTNRHQVRVLVYEGDTFDLGAMTYNDKEVSLQD